MGDTYNPSRVNVIIGAIPITGQGNEEFFTAAYDDDHVTVDKGLNSAVFVEHDLRTGTFSLTLMRSNPDNQLLMALDASKEVFPVYVQDPAGLDLVTAAKCRFKKVPDFSKAGNTSGTVTWEGVALSLFINHGGLTPAA